MGIKRKKEKRAYQEYLTKYAVKIKCCYCDLYESCAGREGKEWYENQDIATRCVMTPNRRVKAGGLPSEIPTFNEYFRNPENYKLKADDLYDRLA